MKLSSLAPILQSYSLPSHTEPYTCGYSAWSQVLSIGKLSAVLHLYTFPFHLVAALVFSWCFHQNTITNAISRRWVLAELLFHHLLIHFLGFQGYSFPNLLHNCQMLFYSCVRNCNIMSIYLSSACSPYQPAVHNRRQYNPIVHKRKAI